jgi:N-acetylmuramoyl-L-alanine amidase
MTKTQKMFLSYFFYFYPQYLKKEKNMKKWQTMMIAFLLVIVSFGATVGVANVLSKPDNNIVAVASASEIKAVQQRLSEFGYYYGPVNGVYTEQTKQAVIKFQRDYGLNAEGYIGPLTLNMLGLSTYTETSTSSTNLYLLAKCVYAEARGESYQGQVAVAAVILNRVKHPSFPNTIAGVVYQPWAFTAVFDGQINLEPNQTAYSAAQDALNGWDPTYGCIYYYNPVTATNKWILSREIVVTIGKHVFAK